MLIVKSYLRIYNKKILDMKLDEVTGSKRDDLTERLLAIKKVFTQLYEDYALERITNDDYFHLEEQYEIEKEKIEAITNKKEAISLKKEQISNEINNFIDNLKSMKIGSELSLENINLLIEKIVISEIKDKKNKRSICIYYKNIGII